MISTIHILNSISNKHLDFIFWGGHGGIAPTTNQYFSNEGGRFSDLPFFNYSVYAAKLMSFIFLCLLLTPFIYKASGACGS